MHCCRIEQTRNQRFQFQSGLLKSPEVADDGMLSLLLRILEHNFGVTQDSSDWGLEFLAHIPEESPMKAVGFGAQRLGFGHCRTLSPPAFQKWHVTKVLSSFGVHREQTHRRRSYRPNVGKNTMSCVSLAPTRIFVIGPQHPLTAKEWRGSFLGHSRRAYSFWARGSCWPRQP